MWSVTAAAAATVELTWDPNPEPNIAGYIVFYGTSSGQYTVSVDVGNHTSFRFVTPDPSSRYYLAVRAYNVSGMQSGFSAEVSTSNPSASELTGITSSSPIAAPLALTSLKASLRSPQAVGTSIMLTASATGGTAPHQFKWLISNGKGWSVARGWSTSNKHAWTPTTNTKYTVMVWARSATSGRDAPEGPNADGSIPYTITPGVAVTRLRADKPAPQRAGSQIVFTATASGARSYKYKWWVFNGVKWAIAKEWSSSNKFSWKPATANAKYQVLVRVRDGSSPSRTSAGTAMPFPIERRR